MISSGGQLHQLDKSPFPGRSQFLAAESPLEIIKNAFCSTLKDILVLDIFKFLSRLFWSCRKTV